MAEVVLVVDMLRGFLESGYPLYCGEEARKVIPNIAMRLEEAQKKGSHIIFTCDAHTPEDPEIALQVCPPHCMAGTEEAQVVPELAGFRTEVFEKHAYSGFTNPALGKRIQELNPEKVVVMGVCTDICVMHTVADAFFRKYNLEVPANCVATFNAENHQFALKHMEQFLGVRVLKPEESRKS